VPTEADWNALRDLLTHLRFGDGGGRLSADDAMPFVRRMVGDAVAAERDRCAREVERLADVLGGRTTERHDGAWVALTRAAASIREGRGP
jgi:hypothetical protein